MALLGFVRVLRGLDQNDTPRRALLIYAAGATLALYSHVVAVFYVAANCRGEGLGRVLHEHAVDVFRRQGKKLMRLSVSISNARAIAFYRKLGWIAVGTRPNKEPMAIMEYPID